MTMMNQQVSYDEGDNYSDTVCFVTFYCKIKNYCQNKFIQNIYLFNAVDCPHGNIPYVRYKIVARKESAGVASIQLIYFLSLKDNVLDMNKHLVIV